ncbi:hypothetical protein [Chitinasiproducens palmae]|uniref:Phosphatidic acid phosphatase type 2/haloperoxidase domain-containing protein n=1 Tax=Chitinasiproducens palmae TaxID=1770053 RepID=A0A1H2PPK8_9BURK|nr:hypothetical protein [Chitinasiproducens palmae]SDV48613.1 hypothetical protein SAMN05216551_105231 [Chitinasiproducens palmae]
MVTVGISKLVWALVAWHHPPLGYRVISGHAMLAFSVWPTVLACCTTRLLRRFGNGAAAFAYAACGLLSISRLAGAHTLIEVVIGACIGIAIDLRWRPRLITLATRLRAPLLVIALMIAVTFVQFGSNVWTPRWFNWLARWLGGG